MENLMAFATANILSHWAFFLWFVVATLLGEVFKKTVWTKENAASKKPQWLWWWGRKTMVLHPVFAGMLLGLVWQHPEPGVDGLPGSLGYFALSGAMSVWGYELIKGLLKQKANIDASLPGLDSDPPK